MKIIPKCPGPERRPENNREAGGSGNVKNVGCSAVLRLGPLGRKDKGSMKLAVERWIRGGREVGKSGPHGGRFLIDFV